MNHILRLQKTEGEGADTALFRRFADLDEQGVDVTHFRDVHVEDLPAGQSGREYHPQG